MKKLLYILLLFPFIFLGQTTSYIEQDVPLELSEGWNMIGYSCYEPIDVTVAFTPVEDKIVIFKDASGNAYLPEWGFNDIGNLEVNRGYQIKVTEVITDFQFCSIFVPSAEGCMDESAFNYNPLATIDDGSCYPIVLGCIDPSAFNYNDLDGDGFSDEFTGDLGIDVNTDDGSCYDIVEGCMDESANNYNPLANVDDGSCIINGCLDSESCNYNVNANLDDGSCVYAQSGFDCNGNVLLQIGDLHAGGIVFKVNLNGTGLVAALEDLTEGASDPNGLGFNGYEWGCYGEQVFGADGIVIGTGYLNTMDIVGQDCATEYGAVNAAYAALNYESEGFNDWYLPSKDELIEMFNTIGEGGLQGNIGNLDSDGWPYWCSTEVNSELASVVVFNYGISYGLNKNGNARVRVIRSF